MPELKCSRPCEIIPVLASMLLGGSRRVVEGVEHATISEPVVIEFVDPVGLCPQYLSLGDPFVHLLSSLAAMFPFSESSSYPSHLRPPNTLPIDSSPSFFASQVVSTGRCVVFAGTSLSTFEMVGVPGEHAVVSMNMVCPIGSIFECIAPGAIRWGFLHQAVASLSDAMMGVHRLIVLHPNAPVSVCESIMLEHEELKSQGLYDPTAMALGVLGGPPQDWLRDVKMFLDEHAQASGYQDRSIRRLFVPAMAAWLKMVDPDAANPVDDCLKALGSVTDTNWHRMLFRFAEMQRGTSNA